MVQIVKLVFFVKLFKKYGFEEFKENYFFLMEFMNLS